MADAPQTRQSLLVRLSEASGDAWNEFVQVYEDALIRYCRATGLQHADACDATQEVLAAVCDKISKWDPDASKGSFRAWLFRVARNVAVDVRAARARRAAAGGSQVERVLADLADPRDSHQVLRTEYQRSLFEWAARHVRSEVRDATWRAFHLTAVLGRTAEDAAAELGLSVGAVYTAKCRVVARIRSRVAHLDEAFPDGVALSSEPGE